MAETSLELAEEVRTSGGSSSFLFLFSLLVILLHLRFILILVVLGKSKPDIEWKTVKSRETLYYRGM